MPAGQEVADKCFALEARSREIDLEYLLEEIPLALSQTREGLNRITRIVRSMKEFAGAVFIIRLPLEETNTEKGLGK